MEKEERIESLKQLLIKEPNDVFLNYVLGIELQSKGKSDAATTLFLKVLELDPTYIPAYFQLGKLYESLGDISSALKYFKNGLALTIEKGDQKSKNEFEEAIYLLED